MGIAVPVIFEARSAVRLKNQIHNVPWLIHFENQLGMALTVCPVYLWFPARRHLQSVLRPYFSSATVGPTSRAQPWNVMYAPSWGWVAAVNSQRPQFVLFRTFQMRDRRAQHIKTLMSRLDRAFVPGGVVGFRDACPPAKTT